MGEVREQEKSFSSNHYLHFSQLCKHHVFPFKSMLLDANECKILNILCYLILLFSTVTCNAPNAFERNVSLVGKSLP